MHRQQIQKTNKNSAPSILQCQQVSYVLGNILGKAGWGQVPLM